MSKFSFGLYLLHMRICLEVVARVFPPSASSGAYQPLTIVLPVIGGVSPTYSSSHILLSRNLHFFVCLLTVYGATLTLAIAAHYLVEAPSERFLRPLVARLEGWLFGLVGTKIKKGKGV
jgi:hypothetical protein